MSTGEGTGSSIVICTYRVKQGKEAEFRCLLDRHWPTLNRLGLVTGEPSRTYRGKDADDRTFFVEIFTWRNGEAVATAHEHPDVAEIWKPMQALTEERGGMPAMEFPHVEPLSG